MRIYGVNSGFMVLLAWQLIRQGSAGKYRPGGGIAGQRCWTSWQNML